MDGPPTYAGSNAPTTLQADAAADCAEDGVRLLIDGARLSRADRLVFPHNDVRRLAALLAETPDVSEAGHRFVVVE